MQRFSNPINSTTGRHGSRYTGQAITVAWYQVSIGSHYREAVTGGNEKTLPEYHIAITVTIRGSTKIRSTVFIKHGVY